MMFPTSGYICHIANGVLEGLGEKTKIPVYIHVYLNWNYNTSFFFWLV